MSIPLDADWNDIPTKPREARGGAFAPADVPLIKDALYALLKDIPEDDERVSKVANLLHRLGRIS